MAAGRGPEGQASAQGAGYRGEIAPPLAPPGRTRWTLVEHPAALARVVAALNGKQVLAIDAEFVQNRGRGPDAPAHRLALLQLAARPDAGGVFVVDAMRLADLSPLQSVLADAHILKLFHGIGADAQVLATRGLTARRTLDLEAVSRSIFGQRESGLQTMLLRATGVRLDKSLQRSDWTRRPLTPAMLGYAARDAEMTLVLYTWLAAHYPWAIALHEVRAEPSPAVAPWLRPFLEGGRAPRPDLPGATAGLEGDPAAQADDVRAALAAVQHPQARARLIRLIADLDLAALAADLRPLLGGPAAEERAGAARALGRLRDRAAEGELRQLLEDPVQDVREAAQAALDHLTSPAPAPRALTRAREGHTSSWTTGDPVAADQPNADWQVALRQRFAANASAAPSDDASVTDAEDARNRTQRQ